MVSGSEVVRIVLTGCGDLEIFGMVITVGFRSQHWCWDPDVWVSEGMRDKWMHIAHIYTGTNVQVYVNGTIRRDWFKDDIFTLGIPIHCSLEDGLRKTVIWAELSKVCLMIFVFMMTICRPVMCKAYMVEVHGDMRVIPNLESRR